MNTYYVEIYKDGYWVKCLSKDLFTDAVLALKTLRDTQPNQKFRLVHVSEIGNV